MVDLQEIITRGRFVFSGAPETLRVFTLVTGRRSTPEIAKAMGSSTSAVLNKLLKLSKAGLIQKREYPDGRVMKNSGCTIFEKTPLADIVHISLFKDSVKAQTYVKKASAANRKSKGRTRLSPVAWPSEGGVIDIAKRGETQLYEFKAAGTKGDVIAREIASFANTRKGGLLFYGIEDNGKITGSEMRLQDLDQRVQNAIHNTIDPTIVVELKEVDVMGAKIILIRTPPWDKKEVFEYRGKIMARKGTNAFEVKRVDKKKLYSGKYLC